MIRSELICFSAIQFPAFAGRCIYMLPVTVNELAGQLGSELGSWATVVREIAGQLFDGDRPLYLTIDEAELKQGDFHRRPGPHVDGEWDPVMFCHPTHRFGGDGLLVLASTVSACSAYLGRFAGEAAERGDCSHLDLRGAEMVTMMANEAYVGPSCGLIHETLPMPKSCFRQFMRINAPGHA